MTDIAWALVLNLHQPHGNLDDLLEGDPWAAREILYALDRIPRSLWPYPDHGRVQHACQSQASTTGKGR